MPVVTVHPARARAIQERLLAWWDAGHRDLPWRYPQDGADPYRVWIAEVMLQQTRVSVVVPYYRRFVRRFPTLRSLARAREEDVLALWSGLGYYARARRLVAAAREARHRFGGLPRTVEELSSLPGFGRYTAGAVASIAFAVRAPCVDGNVARVLDRVFAVDGAHRERLWAIAAALVPEHRPGDFNQALMELGATVCLPGTPACGACPLARRCATRRRRLAPRRAARPRRDPGRVRELACAVVRRGAAILLVRTPRDALFGGLWALPHAVVWRGDDPAATLARAVEQETGLALLPTVEAARVDRALTHVTLRMRAYECGRVARLLRRGHGMWYPLAHRDGLDPRRARGREAIAMATAMRKLIEALPARQ